MSEVTVATYDETTLDVTALQEATETTLDVSTYDEATITVETYEERKPFPWWLILAFILLLAESERRKRK